MILPAGQASSLLSLLALIGTLQTEVDPQLLEAQKLIRDRQPAKAISLLSDYLESSPDSANALFFRGTAYQVLGDEEKAIADFGRATDFAQSRYGRRADISLFVLQGFE